MGLSAWLNLKPADSIAFAISGLVGFGVGINLPVGSWAVYGSILVSYHLFLMWLVLTSEGDAGISMPILQTVATHLACIVLIAFLGMARHVIPYFGFVRYGIAGLAVFERGWLFTGSTKKNAERAAQPTVCAAVLNCSAEDYEAWMYHLANRGPASMRSGRTVRKEYEEFLTARHKNRATVPQGQA